MKRRTMARTCALALLGAAVAAQPAAADEIHPTQGLRKALTAEGVREHQRAFQAHTDAHGGSRTGGSSGYEASVAYVTERLQSAGYAVGYHSFTFQFNADRTPPRLEQLSPVATTYVDGVDFASMTFTGSGDVTAPVAAVDLVLPPGSANSSTSGCEAADFAGFAAGNIALVQRGTCTFAVKAQNAKAAGAVGVVVFNEGQAGRTAVINGTLGSPSPLFPPTVGASFATGESLAGGVSNGPTGAVARLRVDRVVEDRVTRNVVAETPGGDPDRVLVVGAHLDSVPRGGGINDNGSGSGAILEIAETIAARELDLRNKVRFIWFSAEEFGLLGSRAYVNDLAPAERSRIFAMLNFDMVGSPNYVRFVYDGDNSAFPAPGQSADGPPGSGEIERVFHDYFRSQGLASDETPFSGRSDYGPFIAAGVGIPAGGLFSGAEGIKTAAQAAVYGGTAGAPYDPCYHLACDDITNVSVQALEELLDAAGHAVVTLAKRNLTKAPLVDPTGPVTGSGGTTPGGGGLHDHDDHEAVPL